MRANFQYGFVSLLAFSLLLAIAAFALGSVPLASLYISFLLAILMSPAIMLGAFLQMKPLIIAGLCAIWIAAILYLPSIGGTFDYKAGSEMIYQNGFPSLVFASKVAIAIVGLSFVATVSAKWFLDRKR